MTARCSTQWAAIEFQDGRWRSVRASPKVRKTSVGGTAMGEIISGERRISLADLEARAARAAAGLAALGVKRGDLIALYLRNDLPFVEASVAAGIVGAYP